MRDFTDMESVCACCEQEVLWHIKAKAYNTCILPQAEYCRGTVHVTDRAGVELIGCRLSLCPQADL